MNKGIYVDRIQCGSMRKSPEAWDNLYGVLLIGMGYNIYARYGDNFTETSHHMCRPCFGKFMIGSKFLMVLIKNQDFGVTIFQRQVNIWGTLRRGF